MCDIRVAKNKKDIKIHNIFLKYTEILLYFFCYFMNTFLYQLIMCVIFQIFMFRRGCIPMWRNTSFMIFSFLLDIWRCFSSYWFQLASFLTYNLTMDLIVMVFSYVAPFIACIMQYYTFYAKPNEVRSHHDDNYYTGLCIILLRR